MTIVSVRWLKKWHPVQRLFVIQMLSMGAMEMSAPFWSVHFKALGQFSAHGLAIASGIAYAGPMVMAMCLTPFWGRLGDRYGHKVMLLRALLALAVTQFCLVWMNDIYGILILRLLQGGLAGFIAAAQAYGTTLVPAAHRSELMARLQVATALGSMIGPLVGGLIFDLYSFAWLNMSAAWVCLGCVLAVWQILPTTLATKQSINDPKKLEVPSPVGALLGLLCGIVLVQAGKMMPQTFFGIYAAQTLQATAWQIGLCYGAVAVGLSIAAPFWGKRFAKQTRSAVLRQVEGITWAAAVVVAIQALCSNMIVFIALRVAWGILLGALLPVFYSLLSAAAAHHQQGYILGLGNSAAKLGALLGIGMGALAMMYLPVAYLFWPVVVTYVVAAFGIRMLRHKPKHTQSNACTVDTPHL